MVQQDYEGYEEPLTHFTLFHNQPSGVIISEQNRIIRYDFLLGSHEMNFVRRARFLISIFHPDDNGITFIGTKLNDQLLSVWTSESLNVLEDQIVMNKMDNNSTGTGIAWNNTVKISACVFENVSLPRQKVLIFATTSGDLYELNLKYM